MRDWRERGMRSEKDEALTPVKNKEQNAEGIGKGRTQLNEKREGVGWR